MSLAGPNRKPALTAAASKIGYSRQTAQKLKELPWQDRAWQVYEAEGSIYFMTRYRSAVARKIDYFAAIVESPGDDPTVDATYNDEGELVSLGSAAKVLEAEGGPELIRRLVSELMVHWDVSGEAYLVRFDVEPFWRILSTQELIKQGNAYSWGDNTFQEGSIDPDGVFRVWKPHPRFHWEPDSPTKHILEDAEELILLRRELKARSQSRLPSGAWILPDTVDFTPFGEDENGTPDDFARELTNHMSMAVKDAGSAASLVPWILTVDRADHPLVVGGYVSFTRDWEVNLDQREALLRSIATGLDVPPEILTGMADLNHWSAWLVSEQAVSQHVAPTVDDILDSLTINWFRPLLEAASVDPEGAVLWRDLSPATVPPDRTGVALDLFRENVISDIAVRRVSDFDEDDAPEVEEGAVVMDAAELLQRINAFGTLRRAGAEWDDAVRAVGLPPIAQIPGLLPITVRAEEVVKNEEAVVSSLDDLLGGDSPLPGAAVTAAVRRRIVATELADLDAELLAWVVEESDKEIDRLLNLALSAALDPIDESLLEPLAQRLEAKIAQAQAAARGWLTRTLGRTPSDEGESLARSQGVQVIIAGIVEAVRRKLFTSDARPDPIDLGRMPDITTPTEAIRNGLSLAGGGPAVYEDGNTSELIGNGQKVKEELAGDGFFVDGYEWKYGNPANTFEPHLRLDGVQFTSWEDPRLAVGFGHSWLRRSHYRPGDHKGCQCAFVQVIIQEALSEGEADLRATNEERLAKYRLNPRPGIDDNPEIVAAAKDKFEHIMGRERAISRFLDPMAESTNGRFQHYGERVKFESSIRDKIWREMQADPSLSVSQAADRVTDGNRYTLMWEADDQFRLSHQRTVESFNRSGWETVADKNAWAPGDDYDGMNYKFAKGDDIVEVQFHTPTSAVIKDESHLLYSELRIMPPGPEADRLARRIRDLWNTDRLHVPPGMESVGTQTYYDLST